MKPAPRAREHGRADVDASDEGTERIECEISARSHPCVQDVTAQTVEDLVPKLAIASDFERQIEQIVYRRDPLVAIQVWRTRAVG